ncbi:glycosyltransferase family 4 protein [Kineococcus sp. NUM-3379]
MLVITNWRDSRHPEAGGAEVVCHELAERFAARGEDVVLLCAAVAGAPRAEERDGYRIVRAGGRFTVYLFALLWLLRHRRQVTGVVDSQNGIPFFTPLAVRRTTPVLLLLHHIHQDQFEKYFPAPVAAFGRWLEGPASRFVYGRRGIVTVSPSTRTGARRRLRLRGDIWVTPPGWSVTESVRTDPPARTAHPSVVCLGRLVPHKRTELVVEAFGAVLREHPEATLTVVGRGPEAGRLHRLAADLGLTGSVTFRDDLDDVQRDRVMASAWLTVNASQGEGWGLSVVEANALGVPALAFRRPGLRDSIVPGETGWLLDDDADLGAAIAGALGELRDEGSARRTAQHARRWAARFTWDVMTERIGHALASEARRLSLGEDDQRVSSDLSTVVTLPVRVLPENWRSAVRDTDVWELTGDTVTILCRSADSQTVEKLLGRLGVLDTAELGEGFSVSVARTADLLRLSSPGAGSA